MNEYETTEDRLTIEHAVMLLAIRLLRKSKYSDSEIAETLYYNSEDFTESEIDYFIEKERNLYE